VTSISNVEHEPALTIEQDATLWCTPRGQVAEQGAKTVFQFTRDKANSLAQKRPPVDRESLKKAVRDVLRLPESDGRPPDYRILRYLRARKHPASHTIAYAVETEPGILAIVYRLSKEELYSRPPRGASRAVLYVSHLSSDQELRDEPLIREIQAAEPESPIFTCDVRGSGESQPDTCGVNSFHEPYGSDFFYAIHSLMLGRPYLGQKTHDVLRVLDWLDSVGHRDIHLVAKGRGALAAAFAALLSNVVKQVTLKHALVSYSAIATSEKYAWPLSAFLPNVLARFDLPDVYQALSAKNLRQIEPWDERMA
jgi:hypothetical protein